MAGKRDSRFAGLVPDARACDPNRFPEPRIHATPARSRDVAARRLRRRFVTLPHVALLVLVAVVWGFNFAVVKAGLAHVPPIAFVALRFATVAALLLPFMRVPRGQFRRVAVLSLVLGVVHFSLMFTGMKGLDVATASIAIQLQVPFAALLAAIFQDEKLGWRRLLGMATAFAGVVVIAGEPRLQGNLVPLLMVVGAACIWAGANILLKRIGDEVGVLALNGWVALLATTQLAVVSFLLEDGQVTAILSADWQVWGSVAFQALLVTVFGYGVWYSLMRRFAVNQVMPFTLLVPIFGVLSGVVVFDDPLTLPILLGGACTVLGVAIVVIRRPRVVAPSTRAGL